MFKQWEGFKEGTWQEGIDVRNFIQKNYKLYEGDDKIAFEGLAFISEELTWIFKGLELTNDIVNMESLNNNIIEHFSIIVESLENEDYILIADILNYEISPLLNDLINLIEESIK